MQPNALLPQIGDKVKIKTGTEVGKRGVIRIIVEEAFNITLEDGKNLTVFSHDIVNYSLAARRAWQTLPKRSGRPRSQTSQKKMVSVRIDIDLWEKLGVAVENGLILSRGAAVNEWIKLHLDELLLEE